VGGHANQGYGERAPHKRARVCCQSQTGTTKTRSRHLVIQQTEVAVARQPSGRRNADDAQPEGAGDEPGVTGDEQPAAETDLAEEDESVDAVEEGEPSRSDETDAFWESVGIEVVEIALPKSSGYTLRAYRPDTELTPTDISDRESDGFPERHRNARSYVHDEKAVEDYDLDDDEDLPRGRRDLDEEEPKTDAVDEDEERAGEAAEVSGDDAGDEEPGDQEPDDERGSTEVDDDADTDAIADTDAAALEDVPVFLGSRGKLYLFRSPEGLVEFVRSGEEHDLRQLSTWPQVAERIRVEDVVPLPEDQYELDLVVENLRGGYDAWDPELIIQAGEIARDLAYALRLQSVQDSLGPGSPLDDLDEVMRAAEAGGLSGFFARRKLKKIGAQAAPLSWRTIIGKISAVVDWRD
jgi:hypothetical protein